MSHIDLNRLIGALEPELRVALEAAASVAVRMGHRYVDVPHWLKSVVESEKFVGVLDELRIPRQHFLAEIDRSLEDASSAMERISRCRKTCSQRVEKLGC